MVMSPSVNEDEDDFYRGGGNSGGFESLLYAAYTPHAAFTGIES